ncbi:hypothetical protein GQ44DRAFT_774471 [Phaeosphaeriaceae sp. PMI808]|nr:hypothetical protein GQ44DRAFT_774471 [Phaeosphaeriaceae sp. PMI808]
MATTITEALKGPSVTFSSPLLTMTSSPAGVTYTILPSLTNWLIYPKALIFANILPILAILILGYIYTRLTDLEAVHKNHIALTDATNKSVSSILCNVFRDLRKIPHVTEEDIRAAVQTQIDEAVAASASKCKRKIRAYRKALEEDYAKIVKRVNRHGHMILSLETNVEHGRVMIADGIPGREEDLVIGDECFRFWSESVCDGEDPNEAEEADAFHNLEEISEQVWGWLNESPSEFDDAEDETF